MSVNLAKFSFIDSSYERYFHVIDIDVAPDGFLIVPHSAGEFIPITLLSSDGENWIDMDDTSNEIPAGASISIYDVQVWNYLDKNVTIRILGIRP